MQRAGFRRWMLTHGYAPRTARHYENWVRRLEVFLSASGRPALRHAGWDDLRAFGDTTPLTYPTRSSLRNAIRAYWQYLGRRSVPTGAIRCPKQPRMICRALAPGALDVLLAAAAGIAREVYAAVTLLYYEALRREECATLRWSALENRPGWIHLVGKGDVEAFLPVHDRVTAALGRLPRVSEWVFPGRYPGTHVSPATVNGWVRIAAATAGLGHVTPHQLRHTSLATANDETGDLRAVQEFARHASPKTTAGYTRATEKRLRAVLGAL